MDNNDILINAINCVNNSELAFCKFISANDSGDTGSHQSGFYIPKNSYKLLFESPGNKGENKEKFVEIMWNDELITQSRFIYYGKGTRNEYRLTRVFGNNDFLDENSVGDLLIICKLEGIQYKAYTLKSEENIDTFLINFNLTPNQTNRLIETKKGFKN